MKKFSTLLGFQVHLLSYLGPEYTLIIYSYFLQLKKEVNIFHKVCDLI
jgi:hypothetical protein